MPLVKRTIELKNTTTTHATSTVEHVAYVPPGKVMRSDIVVEPSSNAQLAELAEKYPAEYAELAKKKGVVPGSQGGDNVRVTEIMAQPVKQIVKTIEGLEVNDGVDEALLWQIFEYETGDAGNNRATIVQALAKKGIKDEAE